MSAEQENYLVAWATSIVDLTSEVNALIKDGYEPMGGVAISVVGIYQGETTMRYAQAMYRRPQPAVIVNANFDGLYTWAVDKDGTATEDFDAIRVFGKALSERFNVGNETVTRCRHA